MHHGVDLHVRIIVPNMNLSLKILIIIVIVALVAHLVTSLIILIHIWC